MLGIRASSGVVSSAPAVFPATLWPRNGVWHEVRDLATLFKDASGTIPVSADGDDVRRIADKSGNGNHRIFGGGIAPIFRDVGGVRWIEFNGGTLRGSFATPLPQPYRRISALRQISWTANSYVYDGGTNDQQTLLQYNATPRMVIYAGAGVVENPGPAIGSDAVVQEVLAGTASSLAIDRGAAVVGNAGGATLAGLSIGGPGAADTFYANVRFYGMLLGNFDAAEASAAVTWLASLQGRIL